MRLRCSRSSAWQRDAERAPDNNKKLIQRIKSLLKRSGFIVAIVQAARAGAVDIKKICWSTMRGRKIKAYLDNNSIRKLHLGTSKSLMTAWLNTDLLPVKSQVVYLDATRPFPFKDGVFDYVYSEHMIEHIDYQGALSMLRECFRVIKPKGKIRISTPDLKVLTSLHSAEKSAAQKHYVDFMANKWVSEAEYCKDVFVINNAFRAWGHQFLYDREMLGSTMSRVGFEDIRFYQPGVSDDENLQGIESHGRDTGHEEINQFVAFAVEAQVPNPKRQQPRRTDDCRLGSPVPDYSQKES
jgi:predicted SAM-dependent methyltransferase